MTVFSDKVKRIVKNIPAGQVMTYKEVARAVGKEKAARAVAGVMANNFDDTVPCHRVIRSDGSLGGYNRGGEVVKKSLLEKEGYSMINVDN